MRIGGGSVEIKDVKKAVRTQKIVTVKIRDGAQITTVTGYIADTECISMSFHRDRRGSPEGDFKYSIAVQDVRARSILHVPIEDVALTNETLNQYRRRTAKNERC